MALPPRAATVKTTAAKMATQKGNTSPEYNMPLDKGGAIFEWIPSGTDAVDSETVFGNQGGVPGTWRRVREDTKGADLADANATIQIGGKAWRVLPISTLTDNRVLTLGTTNARAGDQLTITRLDVEAFTYQIDNGGAGVGTLVTFAVSVRSFADLQFDGTNWLLKRASQMP